MTQPSYVLRVTRGKQPPVDLEFAQARVTIGREAADVSTHDPGCSSRHAEILFADGMVKLRDVGSTNGTWRGTTRINEEYLAPGVKFTLGGSTLELVTVKGVDEGAGATLVMAGPRAFAAERTEVRPPPAATTPPAPAIAASAEAKAAPMQRRRLWITSGLLTAAVIAAVLWRSSRVEPGGGTANVTTPVVKLAGTRTATVKAVWFKGPIGPEASGGTSATTVRISPSDKAGARVGVIEEFAGGAGEQWKTAAWLAAFSSTQRLGQSLIDYEFLVETGGQIDGPSAGMLITSTMLAILRGKAVRADTTMTGTINPDGSAGPVGGIVQKMDGAAKAGIKRFGFPMGARNHLDLRTGKTVDLLEAAREFGLEAREIHDVFEAYEFLTGDTLARPAAVAETEMELDADTAQRLRTKNEKWTARLQGEIAGLRTASRGLGPVLGKTLEPIAERADGFFKRAQDYERSDFLAMAYDCYVQAAVFATITKERARFLRVRDDVDGMLAQVEEAATVQAQLKALGAEVELQGRRTTGGGQINALRSFQALVSADCFAAVGNAAIADADELLAAGKQRRLTTEERQTLQDRLYRPILCFAIARTLLEVANDQRDFGTEEGQSPPLAADAISRSAAAYGSAAGAVLAYLESLAGPQLAGGGDDDYLIALRARNRVEVMTGDARESNLLRLAAGSLAFLKGASLVNKYYSLGGEVGADGTLTLTNRKALVGQLDLGRQLAREAAAKAKAAVGFVPIASRLAYQLAVARRDGDDKDKLAALEAFWESAWWSELAAASRQRPR